MILEYFSDECLFYNLLSLWKVQQKIHALIKNVNLQVRKLIKKNDKYYQNFIPQNVTNVK